MAAAAAPIRILVTGESGCEYLATIEPWSPSDHRLEKVIATLIQTGILIPSVRVQGGGGYVAFGLSTTLASRMKRISGGNEAGRNYLAGVLKGEWDRLACLAARHR